MVRQRTPHKRRGSLENLYEQKPRSRRKVGGTSHGGLWQGKLIKLSAILAATIFVYFVRKGYQESYLTTPFASQRVVVDGSDDPDRFWGSYRSGLYFGMKTRTPGDLMTGLMWFMPEFVRNNDVGLRHWCDQRDNLDKYGWVKHDGKSFGVQEIYDRGVKLTTSFVKSSTLQSRASGGSWTARIRGEMKKGSESERIVSFFYYAALDTLAEGHLNLHHDEDMGMTMVSGTTSNLGDFRLFTRVANETNVLHAFYATAGKLAPDNITNAVFRGLSVLEQDEHNLGSLPKGLYAGLNQKHIEAGDGFVAFQINARLPFEFDIVFQSGADSIETVLSGEEYTESLSKHVQSFDARFESIFGLKGKGFDEDAVDFAQAALSNMLGGIGYFYGSSIVKSDLIAEPRAYWPAPLYTAVPSRSFFPRGFLWDEGFHNLLISKWSSDISTDIVAHWLDLLNCEGWIPREQILGPEARAKVPPEFVVQSNRNANPPTLLLTLHSMVKDFTAKGKSVPEWFLEALRRMWPRLVAWHAWFDTTQAGSAPGTFRWRGRNRKSTNELNPKTLTSGLDDFPRASHPTADEIHVDLRCWMALAASLMADIGTIVGYTSEARRYNKTAAFLHDNALLDELHWSAENEAYLDYGLHSEGVLLQRPSAASHHKRDKVRVVIKEPKLQHVNQVGYVSLFPLILEVLSPSSPNLPKVLASMEDPRRLFTPFGLRSLSKEASLYNKENTEHDPPYWRGPIWLNINYLAVRALYNLSRGAADETTRADAARIYQKLRTALIDNVLKQYYMTGYIWEQYDDKTGKGKGCKPFTGWSSLVVLLMSENY